MKFLTTKLNLILGVAIGLFMAGYLAFSGLATSLDFEIEKALSRRSAALEEYEQLVAVLAQARGRENLIRAGSDLGLVEITLADGYVDIRPQTAGEVDNLAKKE